VGEVTSGSPAPSLEKNIGLGYVEAAAAEPGRSLLVDCRGKMVGAEIVSGPFYKRGN
jgi:aminomethyltransferase